MSSSSGLASSLARLALCPSQWLHLVCKILKSLLGLSETNTIGWYVDSWSPLCAEYTGEHRNRREENVQGALGLPCWHKTRDLSPLRGHRRTPGKATLACAP